MRENTQTINKGQSITDSERRKGEAKIIMNLFKKWNLDGETKLILLGQSPKSRQNLIRYQNGAPLPKGRDMEDRVGWLLSIHKALRLLYPENENTRYSWVNKRNKMFDNYTPVEIMKEQGIIGIAKVARYLDYYRGQ
ncbi:MAG: DUF2384 domain-containing protein [SAR324 cluster bacterium]|nr:DUF2384 domain-containing protein [SAR324 cluster bacterium]